MIEVEKVTVRVWKRAVGLHRAKGDPCAFQADIVLDSDAHHGLGQTASEALLRAANHWNLHGGADEGEADNG